jgi:hypothetical protein
VGFSGDEIAPLPKPVGFAQTLPVVG